MIVKIQPPNPNVENAVGYNEKKMSGVEPGVQHGLDESVSGIEDGYVLHTENVPEGSTLLSEFDRLRLNALKKRKKGPQIEDVAFHMSVNPSDSDKALSDKETVAFVRELMDGMGYGQQPYRIYKHTDIPRTHFHVVSTRVGQDGKKVDDSFEIFRLRRILQSLEEKYGFSLILTDEEERRAEKKEQKEKKDEPAVTPAAGPEPTPGEERKRRDDGKKKSGTESEKKEKKGKRPFVPPFSRKSDKSVGDQIKAAAADALEWHFSTFEQFRSLMLRRYNVLLDLEGPGEDRLVISGTDPAGKPITPPIREEDMGIKLLEKIREKIASENMSVRRSQKEHIESLAKVAANASSTYEEFVKNMEQKGVWVVVSWNRNGEPFGVTWLDRAKYCAWKGSETKADMKWLKEVAASKGWTITPDRYAATSESATRRAGPSREKKTIRVRRTVSTSVGNPVGPAIKGAVLGAIAAARNSSHGSSASVLYNPDERIIYEDEDEENKNKMKTQ